MDALTQPPTLFSRDLKYMLDARHAAAPLRRRSSRRLLLPAVVVAACASIWGVFPLVSPDAGPGIDPSSQPRTTRADSLPPANGNGPGDRSAVSDGFEHAAPSAQPASYIRPEELLPGDRVAAAGPPRTDVSEPENGIAAAPELELEWNSYSVRRGDTLGKIFRRFSIELGLASRIVEHELGETLKKLLPEHKIHFGYDAEGNLARIRYEVNRLEELIVEVGAPDDLAVSKRTIPTEVRERSVSQIIGSSLFLSASKVGLSDRLIMQLVAIFGWEIDFALDIRSGDRFSIIYEEILKNGEVLGTGDIIAAEFINDSEIHHAVRHIDDEGRKQYFDLDGQNLRGTFLRTPMRVSRITSGFSKARFHPVLKKWRAHRGVDYGAPTGTPVLATGDGRVHSLGRNGGYGNSIVLRHGGRYSTLYAHLSRFRKGLGRGSTVQQGDVIGYVGSTGLATGPHLHYEFRVNGVHRDPLTYETPKAQPISDQYRDVFLAMAQDRIDQIADIRPEQVASR